MAKPIRWGSVMSTKGQPPYKEGFNGQSHRVALIVYLKDEVQITVWRKSGGFRKEVKTKQTGASVDPQALSQFLYENLRQ